MASLEAQAQLGLPNLIVDVCAGTGQPSSDLYGLPRRAESRPPCNPLVSEKILVIEHYAACLACLHRIST